MNDLEWLARNVHEWPTLDNGVECEMIYRHDAISTGWGRQWPTDPLDGSEVTRDQWLAERARLQNKPSWEDAPEWAMWLCQTSKGDWFFCESKQKPYADKGWDDVDDNDAMQCMDRGEVLGDWRDTLERRPEYIEPEQPEWKQGELPPVGCIVECDRYANPCTVKYASQYLVVVQSDFGEEKALYPKDIRPLRTEEDRAVEEIQRDGMGICHISEAGARALFKAGYRKQETSE